MPTPAPSSNPHREGKPVGFAYQEPNHPASYQVIDRQEERLVQTTDLNELARQAKKIPGVVWLTREQIEQLRICVGAAYTRPLTAEERAVVEA